MVGVICQTRTWLACPRRDEGLGEGYGGEYFASVAAGTITDEDVARGRKMAHTAFAPEEGQKVRSGLIGLSD